MRILHRLQSLQASFTAGHQHALADRSHHAEMPIAHSNVQWRITLVVRSEHRPALQEHKHTCDVIHAHSKVYRSVPVVVGGVHHSAPVQERPYDTAMRVNTRSRVQKRTVFMSGYYIHVGAACHQQTYTP